MTHKRTASLRPSLLGNISLGSAHRSCGPEIAKPVSQAVNQIVVLIGSGRAAEGWHCGRAGVTTGESTASVLAETLGLKGFRGVAEALHYVAGLEFLKRVQFGPLVKVQPQL